MAGTARRRRVGLTATALQFDLHAIAFQEVLKRVRAGACLLSLYGSGSVMDENCPVQSCLNLGATLLHSNEPQVNGEGALPRRDGRRYGSAAVDFCPIRAD